MILDIVFAAGCFWGVEKHFENIDGVIDAVSGYAGGNYENPNYDQVLSYRNMQSKDFYEFLKTLGFADETLKEKVKDIALTRTSADATTPNVMVPAGTASASTITSPSVSSEEKLRRLLATPAIITWPTELAV